MATYKQQIDTTRAAHMAARAISDAVLVRLDDAFNSFDRGDIDISAYHTEARRAVRFAYRESASIAKNLSIELSGIEDWEPAANISDSDYLKSLLGDVKKNIDIFKNGNQDEKAKRRLHLRIGLSATTASQRGFTDSQIAHYEELQELGHRVVKLWLANFVNNDPCNHCRTLHNTRVRFGEEFPVPTLMRTAVYKDLQGPPLHVQCKCVMVVLIQRAENLFEVIPRPTITPSTTMSTETVKRLPSKIFNAIIRVLRMITRRRNV